MSILKLNEKWISYLLKYPETGMGYQLVNIELYSGITIGNVCVMNGEDVKLPGISGISVLDIKNIYIAR